MDTSFVRKDRWDLVARQKLPSLIHYNLVLLQQTGPSWSVFHFNNLHGLSVFDFNTQDVVGSFLIGRLKI
jgi:hypothetical protein